jgi:hypothetical protein
VLAVSATSSTAGDVLSLWIFLFLNKYNIARNTDYAYDTFDTNIHSLSRAYGVLVFVKDWCTETKD